MSLPMFNGDTNRAIELFEDTYEASVVVSPRVYRRVKRATLAEVQEWYSTGAAGAPPNLSLDHQTENVKMVEIVMPLDKVPELVEAQESFWWNERIRERHLREDHPILQQLWDQYQTMLALLR